MTSYELEIVPTKPSTSPKNGLESIFSPALGSLLMLLELAAYNLL